MYKCKRLLKVILTGLITIAVSLKVSLVMIVGFLNGPVLALDEQIRKWVAADGYASTKGRETVRSKLQKLARKK